MNKKRVVLVLGGQQKGNASILNYFTDEEDVFVGVDVGTITLLMEKHPIELAVGDFDSISKEQMQLISEKVKERLVLQEEKDDTDTQAALMEVMDRFPNAYYILVGATTGRLDHLMSNFLLPLEERFRSITSQLVMIDRQNFIRFYEKGTHEIEKIDIMKYVGIYAMTPVEGLSIQNAKYNLEKTNLSQPQVYPSNEFLPDQNLVLSLDSGIVAVIQSKDHLVYGD